MGTLRQNFIARSSERNGVVNQLSEVRTSGYLWQGSHIERALSSAWHHAEVIRRPVEPKGVEQAAAFVEWPNAAVERVRLVVHRVRQGWTVEAHCDGQRVTERYGEFCEFPAKVRPSLVSQHAARVAEWFASATDPTLTRLARKHAREELEASARLLFEPFLSQLPQLEAFADSLAILGDAHHLPWELLPGSEGFLVERGIPIVRLLNGAGRSIVGPGSPLRLLLLSNPTGDVPGTDTQANSIYRTLSQLAARRIAIDWPRIELTTDTVDDLLRRDGYDIFHYSGHASTKGLRLIGGDYVPNRRRASRHLLTVLNACDTATATDFGFPTVAEKFLAAGSQQVVAATMKIQDQSAANFAIELYRALAEGSTIEHAVDVARHALLVNQDITAAAFARFTFSMQSTELLPAGREGLSNGVPVPQRQRDRGHVGARRTRVSPATPIVYLAYAPEDRAIAEHLRELLTAEGFGVRTDLAGAPGEDVWIRTVEEGIRNAALLLVLVSEHARRNPWILREIALAEAKGKRTVLGLLHGDVPPHWRKHARLSPFTNPAKWMAELTKILSEAEDETTARSSRQRQAPFALRRRWYLERLLLKHSIWLDQYTPMAGIAELLDEGDEIGFVTTGTQIDQEFEAFLTEHSPGGGGRVLQEEAEDIIGMLGPSRALPDSTRRHISRAAILGEPGAGKTTTLWRLVAEYARAALVEPEASIPVLVELGKVDRECALKDYIDLALAPLTEDLQLNLGDLAETQQVVLLLDGLNEIPPAFSTSGLNSVKTFLRSKPQLPVFVTCRETEYVELNLGLSKLHIKPLDPIRILNFLRSYIEDDNAGEALFWQLAGKRASDMWQRVSRQITEREFWLAEEKPSGLVWRENWPDWLSYRNDPRSMLALASNPFLLYMIARVYARFGVVPPNKGQLFQTFVNFLLREVRDQDLLGSIMSGLSGLAYQMQSAAEEGTYISPTKALEHLGTSASGIEPKYLIDVATNANLLRSGVESVSFTHQLLQEYFASRELDELRRQGKPSESIWPRDSWWTFHVWDETAIMLTGLLGQAGGEVARWVAATNPELAARCIRESGTGLAADELTSFVSQWNAVILAHSEPVGSRAGTARALAILDCDRRRGIGCDSSGLPEIAWTPPIGTLNRPFRISRYLVTNQQFNAFAARAYLDDQYWTEPGLRWRDSRSGPEALERYPFALGNHPRVHVRWFEALAFCRWLSAELNADITLPTEREWLAGWGSLGQTFPYGDHPDPTKANTKEGGLSAPTAVGIFPDDCSPNGVFDLSGNVREWCLNSHRQPDEEDMDARALDRVSPTDWRAVRGGSFQDEAGHASAYLRSTRAPADQTNTIGFRLVTHVGK